MIVLFLELLLLYVQGVYWDSNDINKTRIPAIRVHFFQHFDISRLLLPMLIYVGLPCVLMNHLRHRKKSQSVMVSDLEKHSSLKLIFDTRLSNFFDKSVACKGQ